MCPPYITAQEFPVSITGENSQIVGTILFNSDSIEVRLKRSPRFITEVIGGTSVILLFLTWVNRRIKSAKKASFNPEKLVTEWGASVLMPLGTLLFFLMKSMMSMLNIMTLLVFGYVFFTLARWIRKKREFSNKQ